MGIAEKLVSAKESYWISEEVPESEVKATVELAKISAQIERSRLEKGMTQQEFAKYMGGFDDLPDDTVICIMSKLVTTKDDLQENSIDLFKAILNFGVEE